MANQKQDEGATAKLTINDIARLAGVSKKTVSRVINRSPLLNRETRDKVEAIIRETGYVPNPQARALALGRNFLIGLIYDNPNAQMVLSMQRGILEALHGTEHASVRAVSLCGDERWGAETDNGFETEQREQWTCSGHLGARRPATVQERQLHAGSAPITGATSAAAPAKSGERERA